MSRLAPLSEEPVDDDEEGDNSYSGGSSSSSSSKRKGSEGGGRRRSWRKWVAKNLNHLSDILLLINKKSDLKLLLSVLGCPLFPVSNSSSRLLLPIPAAPTSHGSLSAQYIIQHFAAATGCRKLEGRVKNMFATGKVRMATVEEPSSAGSAGVPHRGCFVMWQMVPNKWLIELVVGGHKVAAGSDGTVAWRHTPWLAAHAAKGCVRPLRRALQGLDPVAISTVFSLAQYVGEKQMWAVDCFVLKLSADQTDLAERSDHTAEMIKHVIFGYFSQRSGLLVYLEDSSLTRIQSPGSYPTYWETTMGTKVEDYRTVEGAVIAHAGQSTVIITRFGENLKAGLAITRMEEIWTIDDVAFDVQGLSMDCFIPPREVQKHCLEESFGGRSPLQ
ncbi:uncharacterized protein LOC131168103 [Malania oleifera]|uniref:uncharacterized protein LOC131168103 n=1 Tax=Malania oleifera TaxID=397392 RepID=UPI0025AEC328|nr:uncharacterized protein LOC131168103 [Malania oleifera]